MVSKKGFVQPGKGEYMYPYPVYYRSPISGGSKVPSGSGSNSRGMGLTTVLRDYGTDILNAIRENDLYKLRLILEKTLRSDSKIARLCVTDIKHKPSKKFACPLILAARQEDARIIKYMMDRGTDPNFVHHTIFSSKRREIVTALHIAVDLGYYDTAEVLLNANADCNIYDHSHETPLHISVKKADHMMVRMLLSKGADPAILDRKSNAALHIATLYGHLQMVRTLLKYDADIYQKGQWDAIPPHIAAREGHIHLIQLFCSQDIGNINVKIPCYVDRREKAPIHLAAEHGHTECLLVLVDQFDADVNLKDSDGNTALHCVVLHPYDVHRMRDKEYFTESARVLIKFRVSINEKNMFGDTALHFAAMNHYHRIVELLLEMGANPFLENEDNMKPIDTVPDSDPVTKQILKMAMMRGRPVDSSMDMSREMTPRSGRRIDNVFDRSSKSNMSYRSSMSSVHVEDVRGHRSRSHSNLRERTIKEQQRRARSHDPLGEDDRGGDDDAVFQDDENSVYQKIENEIPVYTKVDKKKKGKHGGSVRSDLGYDQRAWEELSTTTMNDDDSIFTQDTAIKTKEKKSKAPKQQITTTTETTRVSITQGEDSPRRQKSKRPEPSRRPSKTEQNKLIEGDELSLDIDMPVPDPHLNRQPQEGEIIYQNIPPAPPQPPPRPPRKSKSGSQVQLAETSELQASYKEEDGIQVHTVPGRPSTIEVQYKGGPITISVDTPKEFYEGSSDESSDSDSEETKPVHHKSKESVRSKGKSKRKKTDPKPKESPPERSPKHKKDGRKQKKISDDVEETQSQGSGYYNSYYDRKYNKKKAVMRPSDFEISQVLDEDFDISHLESQPELVKKLIQQKVAEITDQRDKRKAAKEARQEKQTWLEQAQEEEEEEDEENIIDSDEWQSAEEELDDYPEQQEISTEDKSIQWEDVSAPKPKPKPTKSKRDPHKFLPPNDGSKFKVKGSPQKKSGETSPTKSRPSAKELSQPPKALHSLRLDEIQNLEDTEQSGATSDDSPNDSPKPLTFKEKLAWAKANELMSDSSPTASPKPTPRKPSKPGNLVASAEVPKWTIKPNDSSAVVESTIDDKSVSEISDDRSRGERSRLDDGDDEREDDSSGISDLARRNQGYHNLQYSGSRGNAPPIKPKPPKSAIGSKKVQALDPIDDLSSQEGSPFPVRKVTGSSSTSRNQNIDQTANNIVTMTETIVSTTKEYLQDAEKDLDSSSGMIEYDADKSQAKGRMPDRAVSPVNIQDIREMDRSFGSKTPDSVMSEGRGLGLRVTGNVPKAYRRQDKDSARRDFMLAPPARIESSSDISDAEMYGSRGSLTDLSIKDRGKLWADNATKPVHSKSPLGLVPSPKPGDTSKSDDGSEDSSNAKHVKIMGGYAKPYKTFGKIEVKTDLIEDAMLNSSIPEDPESLSDLEPFNEETLQKDNKVPPSIFSESTNIDQTEINKPKAFRVEEFDEEPGSHRFHHGQRDARTENDHTQLSPQSDTSEKSRKVVSLKEEKTNELGQKVETITTTVVKTNIRHPQIDIIKTETVGSTDDLSFDDSTFDLDDLVTTNSEMRPPDELPPPPPELMNTDDSQEILDDEPQQTQNTNTAYVEEIDEQEMEEYIKQEKLAKKSKKAKSKKSMENLTEIGQQDDAKKGKKKKKKKTKEDVQNQLNTEQRNEDDVTQDQQTDIALETYDNEPGKKRRKKKVKETVADDDQQVGLSEPTDTKIKPQDGAEQSGVNVEVMEYDDEPGQRRGRRPKHLIEEKIDQSMTDIEVAQITDAAEVRRRAREAARSKRDWHIRQNSKDREPVPQSTGKPVQDPTQPNARRVTPSPKSFNIVVEGGAEITTSKGKLPTSSVSSDVVGEPLDEEPTGGLLSMGSKREKKKKKKSTENLLDVSTTEKKKKKKKKVGSQDNLNKIENQEEQGERKKKKKKKKLGSQENLVIPSGKVHGVPEAASVVSEVWQEAMEGQPLASSETVYDDTPKEIVIVKKTKKKSKSSTSSEHTTDVIEQEDPAGYIKRAAVPTKPQAKDYPTYDDDDDIELPPMDGVPMIQLNSAQKAAMAAAREAKRKENALAALAKGKKLDAVQLSEDDELPPPPPPQQTQPTGSKKKYHAVQITSTTESMIDDSDDESSVKGMIQKAVIPQPDTRRRHSLETSSEEDESGQAPTLQLSAAQKAKMLQQRSQKMKQQNIPSQSSEIIVTEETMDVEIRDMNESPTPRRPETHQTQVQRPYKAVQLNQDSQIKFADDEDDDPMPGNLVKKVNVPSAAPKATYESQSDDYDEDIGEEMGPAPVIGLTTAQRKAMISQREAKRHQQDTRNTQQEVAQKQPMTKHETNIDDYETNIDETRLPKPGSNKPSFPPRPQHAIQLNTNAQNQHSEVMDEIPSGFVQKAKLPKSIGSKKGSYDNYNMDDSSEDTNEDTRGVPVIGMNKPDQQTLERMQEQRKRLQMSRERKQEEKESSSSSDSSQESSEAEQETPQDRGQVPQRLNRHHAINLNQYENTNINDYDDEEPMPSNLVRKAQVAKTGRQQSYETNLDDLDPDSGSEGNLPTLEIGQQQKAAMASIREAKRQQKLQAEKRRLEKQQQEQELMRQQAQQRLEEEETRQRLEQEKAAAASMQRPSPAKPPKPQFAMKLDQPHNKYQEADTDEPIPGDAVKRAAVPQRERTQSYETNIDDIEPDPENSVPVMGLSQPPQVRGQKGNKTKEEHFKDAAFSALRDMQQGNRPPVAKKPGVSAMEDEETVTTTSGFSRAQVGRVSRGRPKKGTRPQNIGQNKEIFIDGPPELMGEDALPPDRNDIDEQLQRDLAKLNNHAQQSTSPIMSELWKGKQDQEDEMQLMLQSIQDPSELDPNYSFEGQRNHQRSATEPKPFRGRVRPSESPLHPGQPQGSPSQDSQQSQQSPKRRPPRGPGGDTAHESPRPPRTRVNTHGRGLEGPLGPSRPRSLSEGRSFEERGRSTSDRQPIKRRVRRPYPSDSGSLNRGHQSDSESLRRRGKTISFYGDYRSDTDVSKKRSRDRAPKMKASMSLEEAAWKQIRMDMDNQPKVQAHRVIKTKGDNEINYTRGIYRPTPVYWRGSQRSLANTSRYDDSELISQLWHERNQSMNTESEGEPGEMDDMSYEAHHVGFDNSQYGYSETNSQGPVHGSGYIPQDEMRVRSVSMYDNQAPSEPHYGSGAFQPVGPPKKVTIIDRKKKKYKEKKDQAPRFIQPGPVDFTKYGSTAKIWMEQVDKSDTQKSQTMYLSTLGDGQPPSAIAGNLPTDEHKDPSAQWVIARGRSLRERKAEYDEQLQAGNLPPQDMDGDPGKQMLLFFKIGENWKDLSWVLFDGLQSDGETLRMLKEIQHRHPDKVNDQVHDMMHRWWNKKGANATIEELQKGLEFLKMAYVEEEYMNPKGIFSEPELDSSTDSEHDAEVNRLIHDYKNRSLNASYDGSRPETDPANNNNLNTGALLKKLEDATVEHIPAKINRARVDPGRGSFRSSLGKDTSHGEYEGSADDSHQHSFVIVQPQLKSSDYKRETNM